MSESLTDVVGVAIGDQKEGAPKGDSIWSVMTPFGKAEEVLQKASTAAVSRHSTAISWMCMYVVCLSLSNERERGGEGAVYKALPS